VTALIFCGATLGSPLSPASTTKKERKTMNSKNAERGLELRRAMFGKETTDRQVSECGDFLKPMQAIVTEHCFGDGWQNEVIDLKWRSLLTVAMLTAAGRRHEIKIHVRGALSNGASREELQALFLHAHLYCGIPLMVDAMLAAKEVFDEIDGEQNA